MKKLITVAVIVGAVALGVFLAMRPRSGEGPAGSESPVAQETTDGAAKAPAVTPKPAPAAAAAEASVRNVRPPAPAVNADGGLDDPAVLKQMAAWLLSPQTSFEEKQATWRKLREAGKVAGVTKELEQMAAEHAKEAGYQATLGQSYIYEIAGVKDMRDQAMLGMKADKTFDTALELDPANWEARFFKATAMSFWPAEMNKGPEVVEQFQKLMAQQEAMPPQPQFAQTYAWLGEQYKKAGQMDDAEKAWQRGAALFPTDKTLQQKLAAPTAQKPN